MKNYIAILGAVLLALPVMAQDNELTVDAQFRARGEYNNGAIKPRSEGEKPSTFVNERARLSVGYKRDALEMKVSFQHTGVWGQDDIKDRDGRVAMNEAWVKLNFGEGFFVKLGRQQLSYDDERILGGLDWHVAGNWHDAAKLGYESVSDKLHLILALNQDGENNRGNYFSGKMPYKAMQTLWYHHQWADTPLGISLLAMNLGREGGEEGHGKTRYMQTLGADVVYKPTAWDVHAAFYYQTGKNAAATKVDAWMATAKAGYSIDPTWRVMVGYDYFSGGTSSDGKVKAFDPLYGTHHKFLGSMDYFGTIPTAGLQDIQAGVGAKPSKTVDLQLNYHYFMTAKEYGGMDKGLGHEVDLQVTAKLMADVTLTAGYSVMKGTSTMDAIKGGSHDSWQDWAWITLNVNPRILFTKW